MLEACQLIIKYGSLIAVQEVSLQLSPGEIIAIIGPNGAGKSTLIAALNGARYPDSGNVLLDGIPLSRLSRRAISRHIGIVAQETELRFPVTVLEFVLGGRYPWGSKAAWGWETEHDLNVTDAVLAETELTGLENRLMNELSGGERQRCLLARAFATGAPFLLLDEPTANLDLAHQSSVLALVRQRCDERSNAAIVITHDINLAAQFADQILLMKQGRAIASGAPEKVLSSTLLREVFDIQVLVDAHPVTGVPRITPVHESHRHV